MKTIQTQSKTVPTPYHQKRHPTVQASQTKLKAILPGRNITTIMSHQTMHTLQTKNKQWQQLHNKQYIPQCLHYKHN